MALQIKYLCYGHYENGITNTVFMLGTLREWHYNYSIYVRDIMRMALQIQYLCWGHYENGITTTVFMLGTL